MCLLGFRLGLSGFRSCFFWLLSMLASLNPMVYLSKGVRVNLWVKAKDQMSLYLG